MKGEQLKKLFDPESIAVIGASNESGSVGLAVMENLVGSGFKGTIYPVNPNRKSVMGIHCYKNMKELPEKADLALVMVPAKIVPKVVKEAIETGTKTFVVMSAGFSEIGEEGEKAEKKLKKTIEENNATLLGPNCLGFIRPEKNLNASFATRKALTGKIALISQSGALCSSILDWALKENVGFKYFVSVGGMLDVNFSDLIDFFSNDSGVKSIVIYMESIKDARHFMSAARGFARKKPIIVAKSGKFKESAKAAVSHTGSMAGNTEVFDAAFKRAGVIRVKSIQDMFNCSEALSKLPLPKKNRLAVITNAGGPGVMATDAIIEFGCRLAELSNQTIKALDKKMPSQWSKSNPVDILGDATPERYENALNVVSRDENIDGLIVLFAPQAVSKPLHTAKTIVKTAKDSNKPVLASWMGESFVEKAKDYFAQMGIPEYNTPEEAVRVFSYLFDYHKTKKTLYETPKEIPLKIKRDQTKIKKTIKEYREKKQAVLNEFDSKNLLKQYGIPVNKTEFAKTKRKAVEKAKKIGFPVALKVVSKKITHKSSVGGVELNLHNEKEVKEAFKRIRKKAKKEIGQKNEGVTVQEMVNATGPETIIGSTEDRIFGPVILFGAGGTAVELYQDKNISLPPLNQSLAEQLINGTKISELLKGYREHKKANLNELQRILVHFSKLVTDHPQIKEIDLNPVVPCKDKFLALDARIVLDLDYKPEKSEKYQKLAIRPYPEELTKRVKLLDGTGVKLRAIMPEDEPRMLDLFNSFSPETIRQRFFHMVKEMNHETLAKYCFNDYDREIAIGGEIEKNGKRKLVGVVRLMMDIGFNSAEFAVVVTDKWQRKGLGTKMLKYIQKIARQKDVEKIWGHVLRDNIQMNRILKKENFDFSKADETGVFYVEKELK